MKINSIFSLFLLSVVAVFSNCSKAENDDIITNNSNAGSDPESENTSLYSNHIESGDNYNVSYKYNKDVVVLTSARQNSYLVKVESDTILYFAEDTPSNLLPQVGGLYSSVATDKLPYGLGNKVVSRTKEGTLYKIVTTGANLDEIFEELVWDATIEMSSLNPVYTDSLGNIIQTSTVWYDAEMDTCYTAISDETSSRGMTIGARNLVTIPVNITKKKGVSIKGQTNLGAFIHSSGNVSLGTFAFYIEPILNLEMNYNTIDLNNNSSKDIWNDVFKILDVKSLPGTVTIGPVVLRPYVELECYMDISASGTFGLTFGKTISARFGFWQNDKNKHYENTTPQKHNSIFRNMSLSGKIEPSFTAKFVLGCGLYTKNVAVTIDPYLKLAAGAEFKIDTFLDNPKESLAKKEAYFKVKTGAEGKMLVQWFGGLKWGPQFTLLDKELFKKTWPLVPSPNNKYIGRINVNSSSRSIASNVKSRAKTQEDTPKYEAKFSLDSGLLTKYNEFYPALLVYKDDQQLSCEKSAHRYIEGQSENVFNFGVYDLRLNQEYQFMPSVYYNGVYVPLDTIVYADLVKATTGEALDIKETSAKLECSYTNLPSWVEAGVKIWNDSYSNNYTVSSDQSVNSDITTASFKITDLTADTEYKYVAYIKDGDDLFSGEEHSFKTTFGQIHLCPDDHHPHVIDLGLPSGTKWCCMDVGAAAPENPGNNYAWGEIEVKNSYTFNNYLYKANRSNLYLPIENDISGTQYDVATVVMGNSWQMPTYTKLQELVKYCKRKNAVVNGVSGILLTGPNGSQIFLPVANNPSISSSIPICVYWSSTVFPYEYEGNTLFPTYEFRGADGLMFYENGSVVYTDGSMGYDREWGLRVRPVSH